MPGDDDYKVVFGSYDILNAAHRRAVNYPVLRQNRGYFFDEGWVAVEDSNGKTDYTYPMTI